MAYKIVIQNLAKEDFEQARNFYKEALVKDLSKRFAQEIKFTLINKIAIHPTAFAIRYKNVRVVHTHKFPFAIHFIIDEFLKTIFIIAIIHTKRLSETIQKR
jgi:hypothetical protein